MQEHERRLVSKAQHRGDYKIYTLGESASKDLTYAAFLLRFSIPAKTQSADGVFFVQDCAPDGVKCLKVLTAKHQLTFSFLV